MVTDSNQPKGNEGNGERIFRGVLKCLALLAAVFVASILLWPQECLIGESGGKRLFAWPIKAGESFEVSFIHSLNLSPITDVIEWSGHDFVVRKSIFKTFGAGVPVPSEGAGSDLIFVDGHYELIGIDRRIPGFTIMTQGVPDHRIFFNGREARLLEFVNSGSPVDILVKCLPLAARLRTGGNHAIVRTGIG